MGADTEANARGGGALQRDHGAPLERLAQLGDALGGVGAVAATIEAAELVAGQAAKVGSVAVSTGADKKGGGVYLSEHLGWGGLTRKVGATVRRGESRLRSLAKGVV